MKLIIDIDDNLYTRLFDNGVDNYDDVAADMAKAIRNCTVIPKDATNGDMIKALFPDGSQVKGASIYVMNDNKSNVFYNFDWWNATYKKETNNADGD